MAPSNANTGFDALFALRSNLTAASKPYALLKYRDTMNTATLTDDEWAIKVYKVVPGSFDFTGVAGQVVQPPYPLGLLGDCPTAPKATFLVGRPGFRDYKGTFWARSAGLFKLFYFYPLQAGFTYDLDQDGLSDVPAGTCLPWLDRLGTIGTPIESGTRSTGRTTSLCWQSARRC